MAPPLKGEKSDKRSGAVIEGKAKRFKVEDGPEGAQQYSAATIALLGGKLPGASAAAAADGEEERKPRDRGKATTAMPVTDFLDKGLGAAQLPRKQQERKDREKAKRMKGQSTHAEWKPEAWMVMRQQFD